LPPLGSEQRVKLQHGTGAGPALDGAWKSKPNHEGVDGNIVRLLGLLLQLVPVGGS